MTLLSLGVFESLNYRPQKVLEIRAAIVQLKIVQNGGVTRIQIREFHLSNDTRKYDMIQFVQPWLAIWNIFKLIKCQNKLFLMLIIHTIVHYGIGRCVSYPVWIGQTLEFAFLWVARIVRISVALVQTFTIIIKRIIRRFYQSKDLPGTVQNRPSDSLQIPWVNYLVLYCMIRRE